MQRLQQHGSAASAVSVKVWKFNGLADTLVFRMPEACPFEWLSFEKVSNPPRTTDDRVACQRRAQTGNSPFDLPLPIFSREHRCDTSPMGLQMSFELQAQYSQRGMTRQ